MISSNLSKKTEANAELKFILLLLQINIGLTISPNLRGKIVIAAIPTQEIGSKNFCLKSEVARRIYPHLRDFKKIIIKQSIKA